MYIFTFQIRTLPSLYDSITLGGGEFGGTWAEEQCGFWEQGGGGVVLKLHRKCEVEVKMYRMLDWMFLHDTVRDTKHVSRGCKKVFLVNKLKNLTFLRLNWLNW